MSPEALIRRYYETFNHGDRTALLDLLTEDVIHDLNQGSTEIGREAFQRFLERMDHSYREQVEDLHILTSPNHPQRAAAEFQISGTYHHTDSRLPPATGQRYRLPVGAFFELTETHISRVTNYYNLQEWLRQISP